MKGCEMTIELVKILEAANKYAKLSIKWFETYEESNEPYDWDMSTEMAAKAEGLLAAYEIFTGRKIYKHEINEELAAMA